MNIQREVKKHNRIWACGGPPNLKRIKIRYEYTNSMIIQMGTKDLGISYSPMTSSTYQRSQSYFLGQSDRKIEIREERELSPLEPA